MRRILTSLVSAGAALGLVGCFINEGTLILNKHICDVCDDCGDEGDDAHYGIYCRGSKGEEVMLGSIPVDSSPKPRANMTPADLFPKPRANMAPADPPKKHRANMIPTASSQRRDADSRQTHFHGLESTKGR